MGALILLLATFIWGTAFLAQKFGSESLGPFAVTCFRNILGGAFLFVCILVRNRRRTSAASNPIPHSQFPIPHSPFPIPHSQFPIPHSPFPVPSLVAGVLCGIPLFAAMAAQQIGIGYTTPGISGFLTTNYMFFIPVLCAVFYRRAPRLYVCAGVVLAIAGTYLICLSPEDGASGFHSIGPGELWTLLCAFLFAVQMMIVDRYAKRCDVLVMSAAQLFTAAILAAPFLSLPSESARISISALCAPRSALPIVYLGVFSSGIAYTLQNFGQARTPPAVAGVVLSMESVFAALSGFAVLGDRMTAAQFLGCALVFLAAVSTQIFDIIFGKEKENIMRKEENEIAVAMRAGFTLIEILVAVAIIGILGAVAVVNVTQAIENSKVTAAEEGVRNISSAILTYNLQKKKYPNDIKDLIQEDSDGIAIIEGGEGALEDPFGNEYKMEKKGKKYVVISAGPDGEFGTEDDIRSDKKAKSRKD